MATVTMPPVWDGAGAEHTRPECRHDRVKIGSPKAKRRSGVKQLGTRPKV